jgi:hypothetical protein
LHTPTTFGPRLFGQELLGGWNMYFVAAYTGGAWLTWNPLGIEGLKYNMRWKDYHNVNLRLSKTFAFGDLKMKIFLDVNNLFNHKDFSQECFSSYEDYLAYMYSLHYSEKLAEELGTNYPNVPGDDRPGEVRAHEADFVPMEATPSPSDVRSPHERVLYYSADGEGFEDLDGNDRWDAGETIDDVNENGRYDGPGTYWRYSDGTWNLAEKGYVDQILEDKAYIDMPNHTYFTFLNPRDFHFGINFTFDFK